MKGVARKWGRRGAPRHVVVSWWAAPELLRKADMDRALGAAYDTVRSMGGLGGLAVFHPERHATDPETGGVVWTDGPHVHLLVYGPLDVARRPPGAFVRVLGPKQESVGGTVAYLLDHAGYVGRSHAIRWWGIASYNKAPGIPRPRSELELCSKCGAELELVWKGWDDDDLLEWMALSGTPPDRERR